MKDNIFKIKKYDEIEESQKEELKEELERLESKLCRIEDDDCEACQ